MNAISEVPNHVAIIMDGNGRWAKKRGLPRIEGHRIGINRVKEIINICLDVGVKYLTVYAFSKENWKRPKDEVSGIMNIAEIFFNKEFRNLKEKGVYFVHLGDKEGLPENIIRIIENIKKNNTEEKKLNFNIAFNYSGRNEIIRALKRISENILNGSLNHADITEDLISDYLYTKGIPDPDLLIRTANEMRVSNFLLWQIAYTELWVTDILWPDFTKDIFLKAIGDYQKRERRFGAV